MTSLPSPDLLVYIVTLHVQCITWKSPSVGWNIVLKIKLSSSDKSGYFAQCNCKFSSKTVRLYSNSFTSNLEVEVHWWTEFYNASLCTELKVITIKACSAHISSLTLIFVWRSLSARRAVWRIFSIVSRVFGNLLHPCPITVNSPGSCLKMETDIISWKVLLQMDQPNWCYFS